jgi:hypothetical protein
VKLAQNVCKYQNMSKSLDGQILLGRVPLTEYARLKETLTVCELIFKMADDRLKHMGLTRRQFSATFLDFQRNSRGYNDKVESADQDVTKRLLNPFLPEFKVFPIPQCHGIDPRHTTDVSTPFYL